MYLLNWLKTLFSNDYVLLGKDLFEIITIHTAQQLYMGSFPKNIHLKDDHYVDIYQHHMEFFECGKSCKMDPYLLVPKVSDGILFIEVYLRCD